MALRKIMVPDCEVDGRTVSGLSMKMVLRTIDDHGGTCWASHGEIAREANVCAKTVQRAIKGLLKLNMITADQRPRTTDIYRIQWESILPADRAESNAAEPRTVGPDHAGLGVDQGSQGVDRGSRGVDRGSRGVDRGSKSDFPKSLNGHKLSAVFRTETRRNEKETKRKRESARAHKFLPPSLGEVIDYWKATSLEGNAEAFHDYYEANGWTQGKNKKIRDWKAAARLWSRNQKNFESKKKTTGYGAGQVYDPNANIKEAWET
jgi:hypothetical protein